MSATKSKAGALVLLASCTLAGLTILSCAPRHDPVASAGAADGVRSKDRLFTPGGTLMYVNLYSTAPQADQQDRGEFACDLWFDLHTTKGTGTVVVRNLGDRISVMRIRLDPDRMRANKLSFKDIERAIAPSRMIIGDDWHEAVMGKTFNWKEKQNELLFTWDGKWRLLTQEQYENIILRATPEGEILRLKDVGRLELAFMLFDISSDVDGHPTATLDLKRTPDSHAAAVIEEVTEKLKKFKKESWPHGMEFEIIPFVNQSTVYAVIETPLGSTREFTSAKCHELGAIAKDMAEVASVTSLVGYQIRTESGASNAGTCLIHLKDQSNRKRTPREVIETLKEKCRALNVPVEFFEPPAFSVFITAGGFSVRVLDKANFSNDERPGKMSETSIDDLLNRKDFASLFTFLDSNYWAYELVIDNDVAIQKGVSIEEALENLAKVVGDDARPEPKFRALVEELSHSSVKNERGEMVPYRLFMQLKDKLMLNEIER